MPTIRVDEEVYRWIQSLAKPFKDTPNSVLRRVAELDKDKDESKIEARMKNGVEPINGRVLNGKWNVNARHALYSYEGNWYNNLTKFTGALFDPYGYILFPTKEDYQTCNYLSIAQETNVQGKRGISSIPGYKRMTE